VLEEAPLAEKSIRDAGLEGLRGLYLIEIRRNGEILSAVSSDIVLHGNDRLIFAGIVDSVVDLQKMRGLLPVTDQIFKLNEPKRNGHLIEAVVSNSCPLVGSTVREGKFRNNYNAAIIVVVRNGKRINKKIGYIVLSADDILLLDARSNFIDSVKKQIRFLFG